MFTLRSKRRQPETLHTDSPDIDLAEALNRLVASNKSMETRLQEYANTINSRDKEIDMLQKMLSESNAFRSHTDSDLIELEELRRNITNLQSQVAASVYQAAGKQQQTGSNQGKAGDLEKLAGDYAYLQAQFADMQAQLAEVNNRNLLLQQQVSRVAELESELHNAQEELARCKQQASSMRNTILKGL